MNLVRLTPLLALFALGACGGNETASTPDAEPKIEDLSKSDEPPKFNFKQEAENIALVLPVETQKAMVASTDAKLADLIPARTSTWVSPTLTTQRFEPAWC